jgi:hypothetical protein
MFQNLPHRILDDIFKLIEHSEPEWRVVRRLQDTPNYDLLMKRIALTIESHLLEAQRMDFDRRWRRQLDELTYRHTAQLDRIEQAVTANRIERRYAGGDRRYVDFMTVQKQIIEGSEKIMADPIAFVNQLKTTAESADTLVIVDPYALSAEDETGQNVSARGTIQQLLDCSKSKAHLHLYCRIDAIDEMEWERLETDLGTGKLSVHLGNLHDRYILAGREYSANGYDATHPVPGWHGSKYWGGAAFGASINGAGKRPTYVLDFKKADINPLISYLDDATKCFTSLADFKTKKAAIAAAKIAKKGK